MDLIGFSELRKTLPPDIQQLIQDAHDQLWADLPDPWYPKEEPPPKSSTELFDQFSALNQAYPDSTNYQVAKQCIEKAIEQKLYQEGMDILFSVNRYGYWTDNLEEVGELMDKTQEIVDVCPEVAVAPQLILRKFRWLRDRGEYQSADKLASLVLSQAANSLHQGELEIGTWSFKSRGDFFGVVEAFLYLKGQIKMYLAQPVEAAIYAVASCQLGQKSERLRDGKPSIIPICLQMLTDLVLDMARSEREQLHDVVRIKNSELRLMEYLSENGADILSSLPTEGVHILKPMKRRVRIELGKLTESMSRSGTDNFQILLHLLKSSIPENLEREILKYHEIEHDYATSVFNVYLAFKHYGHLSLNMKEILLLSMRLFLSCYGGDAGKDLGYFQQELSKIRDSISNLLGNEETGVTGNPEHKSQYPVLRGFLPIDLLRDFQNPAITANDLKKSALATNVDTKDCPTTVDPVATTLARRGLTPSNMQKFKPKLFHSADFRPSDEKSEDLAYRSLLNQPTLVVEGFDAPQRLLAAIAKEDGTEATSQSEEETSAWKVMSVNTTPGTILQTKLTRDTVYQANVARYYTSEDQWRYQKTLVFIHDELELAEEKKGQLRDAIKLQYLHQDSREVMYIGKRHRRKTKPKTYHDDVIMHQLCLQYVTRFNKQIQHPEYANKIRMVPTVYMEILDEDDHILEVLNVEPFIHGKFTKMTNNLDTVNSKVDTQLQLAFSHFTWCDSDGQLIVTDHQGWIPEDKNGAVILTDPAINSENLDNLGLTNMGDKGLKAFWTKQHPTCNEICRLLKLERDSKYNVNDTPVHSP